MPAPKPKPRMLKPKRGLIKTKRGRLLDSKVVRDINSIGVVSLKKAQGKNTKRAIKKNLRILDKEGVKKVVASAKKSKDPKRALLEHGIDARQLMAKGFFVSDVLGIFGFEDTARQYGIKKTINAVGGLEEAVFKYGKKGLARSVGIIERENRLHQSIFEKLIGGNIELGSNVELGVRKITDVYGLEDAYCTLGVKNVNEAYGGTRNIMKIYGEKRVKNAEYIAANLNPDYYKKIISEIKTHFKKNGDVSTAIRYGKRATAYALGLSTEQVSALAKKVNKFYKK